MARATSPLWIGLAAEPHDNSPALPAASRSSRDRPSDAFAQPQSIVHPSLASRGRDAYVVDG